MRRKLVLGVGFAALVGGSAIGQFAVDRPLSPTGTPMNTPKTAQPPSGLQPVAPSSPPPMVGGYQPLTPPVAPASPRLPTSPTTPGYTPLYSSPPATGAYVPPTDGIRPASYGTPAPSTFRPAPAFTAIPVDEEIPSALGKDHPWAIKPEHGPWFILVKSYVRPAKGSRAAEIDKGLTARELAEGLASEIRNTFRVQAFLYEYISEERKAEHRAIIAARVKARDEYLAQLNTLRQRAQLQGMEFLMPDNKLHIMKHETRDHIGVLVGGFQSEDDAIKALTKLKTWPAPKNEMLMDFSAIVKPGSDGKAVIEKARLNPYSTAFVVGNPSISRAARPNAKPALDPFIVKLNDDNPYSLLKATKNWTLAVKSFTSPVEIVNKDSDTSLMRKFGVGGKGGDVLAAGAEQAEAMAKAIRAMKGRSGESLNLEAFVLHTRNASLVTVGQFNGPDDPALHATRRLLASITPRVSEDQQGLRPAVNAPTLFDKFLPMPIPKKQ